MIPHNQSAYFVLDISDEDIAAELLGDYYGVNFVSVLSKTFDTDIEATNLMLDIMKTIEPEGSIDTELNPLFFPTEETISSMVIEMDDGEIGVVPFDEMDDFVESRFCVSKDDNQTAIGRVLLQPFKITSLDDIRKNDKNRQYLFN